MDSSLSWKLLHYLSPWLLVSDFLPKLCHEIKMKRWNQPVFFGSTNAILAGIAILLPGKMFPAVSAVKQTAGVNAFLTPGVNTFFLNEFSSVGLQPVQKQTLTLALPCLGNRFIHRLETYLIYMAYRGFSAFFAVRSQCLMNKLTIYLHFLVLKMAQPNF